MRLVRGPGQRRVTGLSKALRRPVAFVRYLAELFRFRLQIKHFSGTIPGSNIVLRILFVGVRNSVSETFFNSIAEVKDLGTVHPLRQNSALAKLIRDDTDIVISTKLPWSRAKEGEFIMPRQLDCMLTLPDSEDDFIKRLRADVRRKARQAQRAGLQSEEGGAFEDYRLFYDAMFLPLSYYRHGERAIIPPFDQIYRAAHRTTLLFIQLNGNRVGGVLIRWPTLFRHFAYLGEFGMSEEAIRDPVLFRQMNMFAYYITCLTCIKRNVTYLGLGDAHPKVNSGLLRFKGSWGADYLPNADFFRYRVDFRSQKRHRLLQACHLIRVKKEELIAVIGVDNDGTFHDADGDEAWRGVYRKFENFEFIYPDGRKESSAGDALGTVRSRQEHQHD